MELSYSIARWRGRRILFSVLPDEEKKIREKTGFRTKAFHRLETGKWPAKNVMKNRLKRWIGKIDQWVVTDQPVPSDIMSEIICAVHASGVPVTDLESFLLEIDPMVPADSKQLIRLLITNGVQRSFGLKLYSRIKSAVEPLLALLLLTAFSPLLLFATILVKIADGGPIIYSQERVGHRGRVFRIFKFRSMRVDAEKGGAVWALASKSDPNLTRFGGFLRASHLDELPQLWNIVRGDMSFIGPRPERPVFVKKMIESNPLFRLRALIKPGVTGWAQVEQGYANSVSDSIRKLEFDLFYMIKNGPLLDLKILFKTVAVLFSGGTEEIKRTQVASAKAKA